MPPGELEEDQDDEQRTGGKASWPGADDNTVIIWHVTLPLNRCENLPDPLVCTL